MELFAQRNYFRRSQVTRLLALASFISKHQTGKNWLMLQSHHTPGPRTGCSRAIHRLFWTKIVRVTVRVTTRTAPTSNPYGPRAAPYEFCLPVRDPWSFNACIISLRAPYGLRNFEQTMNSPCGDRAGPVRQNTTPVWDFCQFWLCLFPCVPVRQLCGSRTGPVGYEKHWRFPNGTRTHRTMYPWSHTHYSTKP